VGGAAASALRNGVPVTITGTASNPVITPDLKGLTSGNGPAAGLLGQRGQQLPKGNLGKALGGLLGRH
jgi:AsmA protein